MGTTGLEIRHTASRLLCALPRLRWMRLAVAGWHFQVDAVSLIHDHIWDGTSLLLRKGIRMYAADGSRVLDLGTGHLGLLAIYCRRTRNVDVTAVDVNELFVENAKIVACANECNSIEFHQSDWFSNVEGTFDLIFGNIPYVPTDKGLESWYSGIHPEIWNGGNDGLAHVRKVLMDVPRFLEPHGNLLLAMNTTYVPRVATLSIIEASPELELKNIIESWISNCEIYVVGLRK